MPSDLLTCLELCQRGEFYRHIESVAGLDLPYPELNRRVLATMFDKDCHRNAMYLALDREFPTVMQCAREIKRRDYRELAHLGQRTESESMYKRVISRILRERPELWASTIHDSVMTTAGNEQYARGVMLDEFCKLGVKPTVRIEKERT